jgi:hypothetical protein
VACALAVDAGLVSGAATAGIAAVAAPRAAGSWPAAPLAADVVDPASADDDESVPRPKPAATASCAAADTLAADIAGVLAAGAVALLFAEVAALVVAFALLSLAFGVEVAAFRAAMAAAPVSDFRLEPSTVAPAPSTDAAGVWIAWALGVAAAVDAAVLAAAPGTTVPGMAPAIVVPEVLDAVASVAPAVFGLCASVAPGVLALCVATSVLESAAGSPKA